MKCHIHEFGIYSVEGSSVNQELVARLLPSSFDPTLLSNQELETKLLMNSACALCTSTKLGSFLTREL